MTIRATPAVLVLLTATAALAETPVERGRYLVEAVLACGNCHSPRIPPAMTIIPGKELSGGRSIETPAFKVTPGNITQDKKTGIGNWTADELKSFLRTGVRPNGVPVAPAMPVNLIKALTPSDLDAVVAFLLTVAPIESESEAPNYKRPFQHDPYPDAEPPFRTEEIEANPIVRGRYLAALSHCLECHTSAVDGVTDYANSTGRGGKRFTRGTVTANNITSHTTKGIGAWTDDEIRRAMTEGIAKDGRALKYPMPWPYFAKLKPVDLEALVLWVRTLPPKE
jgi:mono/diheme cytochrome c family protein